MMHHLLDKKEVESDRIVAEEGGLEGEGVVVVDA